MSVIDNANAMGNDNVNDNVIDNECVTKSNCSCSTVNDKIEVGPNSTQVQPFPLLSLVF